MGLGHGGHPPRVVMVFGCGGHHHAWSRCLAMVVTHHTWSWCLAMVVTHHVWSRCLAMVVTHHLFLRCGTWRSFSSPPSSSSQTDGEARVARVLREKFPGASAIKVVDISGGCGAMYEIHIESEEFREKRTVQQHQMVNQALSEEIKSMHGLRIFTSTPKP
ncbi:PREDICTED: bolA-like protein 3 [Calidris pugnax]|uniref:bolA-like protein 3 n=1 Tax=Calidris pugnax TaxID=198806 RepID=UPI00071C80C5|nr:PREDICTED: bolA-like protein 3 [Calidris pugnax]